MDTHKQETWYISQQGKVPHIFDYYLDSTLCGISLHRDAWQCYTFNEQICVRCRNKRKKSLSVMQVTVQASDIRKMIDYYQRSVSCHFKNKESE